MRLNLANRLPRGYDQQAFAALMRDLETQINLLAEGKVQAATNATTAAPTGATQPYQKGDFVRNTNPSEAGGAGSKYVIIGWICTVAGSPGTWLECRTLTGN